MAADYEKPQAWSDLSREARRIAYQVRDDGIRGTVLLIAKEYENSREAAKSAGLKPE